MADARVHLRDGHRVEGVLRGSLRIEGDAIGELVEALALEVALHLAEDHLDRVVVRTVGEVKERQDLKVAVGAMRGGRLVDGQIVHEDAKYRARVHEAQPVQELAVVECV